jgi:tetratricopeptide (TPR) repeat protein
MLYASCNDPPLQARKRLLPILLVIVAFIGAPVHAQAPADPQAAFERAMADVKKSAKGSPAEAQAMERAIAAARRLPRLPAVPDAIFEHQGRAKAAARAAKAPADFVKAADAFGEAARLAPWVAENYFNRGIMLEKAERYDEAERALQLYLKAAPDAADRNAVRERIGGLRYLKEEAERAKSQAQQQQAARQEAERKRREGVERAKSQVAALSGAWVMRNNVLQYNEGDVFAFQLDAMGDGRFTLYATWTYLSYLRERFTHRKGSEDRVGSLDGNRITGTIQATTWAYPGCPWEASFTGEVLEGGRKIVLTYTRPILDKSCRPVPTFIREVYERPR